MSGYGSSNPYGTQQQGGYSQQPSGGYGNTGAYDNGSYNTNTGGYGDQPQQTGTYGGYGSGDYSTNTQAPHTTTVSAGGKVLPKADFLARVEAVRTDIDALSTQISNIASQHQKLITSTDPYGSQTLEALISSTQVLNTKIRDQIKYLEIDAARSGGDSTKDSQVRNLKTQFKNRLEQYQQEEVGYKKRYQEQIARQYRIVNPGAGEDEVREAVEADWGDEGVFQTALKSNRTGHATSVLGAVRARHNDIVRIEKTLLELHQLFQDLAEQVEIQQEAVQRTEEQTENVKTDTEAANVQLGKGIHHARNARRMKWCLLISAIVVIIIIAIVLAVYFASIKPNNNKSNNNNSNNNNNNNNPKRLVRRNGYTLLERGCVGDGLCL